VKEDVLKQEYYHALGEDYWWLAGNYDLVYRLLDFYLPPRRDASRLILDVGSGPGTMLNRLKRFGTAIGLDYSLGALNFCRQKGHLMLVAGDLHRLPLKSNTVDCVTAIEVLEHIEDDRAAIEEMHRVCRERGIVVIMAPAFNFLWGSHDEWNEHKRRYTLSQLKALVITAGFKPIRISYYRAIYFLPLLVFRRLKALLCRPCGASTNDFIGLPSALNKLLRWQIASESHLLKKTSLPIGVSVVCVAQKT
jgi:SAM-dependent methyltransferase